MYYLMLILGVFLFVLFRLNKAMAREDFSWKVFFKKNIPSALVNLLVGVIMILAKEDVQNIYPITLLSSAILGFGGAALWQSIVGTADKDIKTKLSLHKKK